MSDQTVLFQDGASSAEIGGTELGKALHSLTGLTEETWSTITHTARQVNFTSGQVIFDEGDVSDLLYVIEQGTVLVFRPATGAQAEYRVAEIGPGQTLGEMAMIDGAPRSLSARAETDCRLSVVDPDDVRALPDGDRRLAELKGSLSTTVVRRMRESNDRYVQALESDLRRAREQQQFGRFFIYILAMMTIGTVVNDVIARQIVEIDIYTVSFAWQYLAILLVPSFAIIHHMGIPFRELGVTTSGIRRSLTEGAVMSLIGLALVLGLGASLRAMDILPGRPMTITLADLTGIIPYVVHSFLQELVGRGLLLSSFRRFLNDSRGIFSNVLAAGGFAMFHLHFGFAAVGLTFVSSIVFGAIYLRHRNLAGVSLLHAVLGVGAFYAGLM